MAEQVEQSHPNEKASAILRQHLHEWEDVVWAKLPRGRRVLVSGLRMFFGDPWWYASIAFLAFAMFAITAGWIDPAYRTFAGLLILAISSCVILGRTGDALFRVLPFHTPFAYGATPNYALAVYGLIWRRLRRVPFSMMSSVQTMDWHGRKAITFIMRDNTTAAFSIFHLDDPERDAGVLEALRRADQRRSELGEAP